MPQFLILSALFLAAGFIQGCAQQPSTTATTAVTTNEEGAPKAELTAADRKAIEEQKLCPVGDAELGSMGDPVKVTVKGRDVYLCCEHCRDTLLAEPDKFLAKLDEQKSKAASATQGADAGTPAEKPADSPPANPGT